MEKSRKKKKKTSCLGLCCQMMKFLIVYLIALILFLYSASYGDYEVIKTVAQDPSLPHLIINDVIFHLETFGDEKNELLLILHGGPGADYKQLLDLKELGDKYYVVMYDQRGTGLSPRVHESEQTFENWVGDLKMIVDHFCMNGREKVNFIGHSGGAMLASAYLQTYPEDKRVNKIVMVASGPLSEENCHFSEAIVDYNQKFIWSFGLVFDMLLAFFKSFHVKVYDGYEKNEWMMMEMFKAVFKHDGSTGNVCFCNNTFKSATFSFWRIAVNADGIMNLPTSKDDQCNINYITGVKESYKNKILFIVGECDAAYGEALQKRQMHYFHEAEMKTVKNAGHMTVLDQPKETIKFIREYLEE